MHTCHPAGDRFQLALPPAPRDHDRATLVRVDGSTVTDRICLAFHTGTHASTDLHVYVRPTPNGGALVTIPDAATMSRTPHGQARARQALTALDADLPCPCTPRALATAAAHLHATAENRQAGSRVGARSSLIGLLRLLAAAGDITPTALATALAALTAGYTGTLDDLLTASSAAAA